MGGTVDLFDVKVVDGYCLRCEIVRDLNQRLKYIYNFYETGFAYLVDVCGYEELNLFKDRCVELIDIIKYLRSMGLLRRRALDYESKRLQEITKQINDYLERGKD